MTEMPQDGGRLLDHLFSTEEMRQVFCGQSFLAQMTAFEFALLRGLESASLIPSGTAKKASASQANLRFNLEELATQSCASGNLAIPFVRELTRQVAAHDAQSAQYIHWGATSQDTQDTATVLQLRAGIDLLLIDLDSVLSSCARLAETFAAALMPGRTWLQQAPPVTFGLKMAGYLDAFLRHRSRLLLSRHAVAVLSLGGAVGTLAAYGEQGSLVANAAADALDLRVASITWHTHRDRLAEVATTIGLLAGTLGKLGRDLSLMMQTELAECAEGYTAGRGGSSTMPHKRNPVSCSVMLGAATRLPGLVATMLTAMVQEHERGLGGWQAEWETLPEIFRITAGSLRHASTALHDLNVVPEAMLKNLEITQGLSMSEAVSLALAEKIGKQRAHQILAEASARAIEQKRNLVEVLTESSEVTEHFSSRQIANLLDPKHYLGSTKHQIDAVLALYNENPHAGL
jgi:3-carboxy-cis,cis-muconate cycloisomerase